MDSVDSLGGLLPVHSSLEEKQRAGVMKATFKTMEHFFGGFSPSSFGRNGSPGDFEVHLSLGGGAACGSVDVPLPASREKADRTETSISGSGRELRHPF